MATTYAYDMSVIVPVYNAEAFLWRCVASLDAQTTAQKHFEVVLVNDGSTDGSLELCRALASTRPNYVVLDQQNQGVSAARNAGMRAAHGRYLMFVDSDDWISKEAIAHLVLTFDRYCDRIDLLALGMVYCVEETGATRKHRRHTWLTQTGVYDLDEYPYLAQSTPNVCIKNEGADTPCFSTSMRMGEDQFFNTQLLARKGALGYCAEAWYYHAQHEGSSTSLWDAPRYAFEDMMRLYHMLLDLACEQPAMTDYAYAMILYNVGWRLRGDLLYPDFGDAATRERNRQRLGDVLRAVPRAHWQKNPYLTEMQRMLLMRRYHVIGAAVQTTFAPGGIYQTLDDGSVLLLERPTAVITWAVSHAERLDVRGFVCSPAISADNRVELAWEVDGTPIPVRLHAASVAYHAQRIPLDDVWCFAADLPPAAGKPYVARLRGTVDGQPVASFALEFDMLRGNSRFIQQTMRDFGDRLMSISGHALHVGIRKKTPAPLRPLAERYRRARKKQGGDGGNYYAEQANVLRAQLPRALRPYRKGCVWLYAHAPEALARDRGLDDGVTRVDLAELDGTLPQLAAFLGAKRVVSGERDFEGLLPCDYRIWNRLADLTREDQTYVLAAPAAELAGTPFDESDPDVTEGE